ncbi:MAG: hypothetical protein KAJ03_08275, partial [Gammaproteobacteria bacterium]|nr:hypothetical protein [Gammaproteobacteria bacterium]
LNLFRQKTDELEQTRKTQNQLLNQQLQALGKCDSKSEVLETVILECEELAQQLDESKRQHDELDKEIKGLVIDFESLTDEHRLAPDELNAWKTKCRELIEGFGLQGDASPSEVVDFIEKLRALFAKLSEAEKLQIRIKSIDDDAESFRGQVASVVESIAPELAELPADDAVMRLNSLLLVNRTRQTQSQQIEEQVGQTRQEIQDSDTTIQIMTDRLDLLCVEAQRDSHAELEEAERRSALHLRIKASIDAVEQEILETGEGATVAELDIEAEGIDPDGLPGRIEELRIKIDDELEPRRTELAQRKGREEKELEIMDGSDQAAVLADQAQAILASIRSDAERYMRVKLAGRVLRDEIERYRKENQGPLV